MKKTLLFIFSLLTLSLLAQDIKFDVLSNAGGRISNVNSASFTFGQPFVGSITNGTNSIRQGFQQPSFMMSVPGCMDTLACNFDSLATIDDNSCAYTSSSTTTHIGCDSLVWNGVTYDSSGTYSYSGVTLPLVGSLYDGGYIFYIDSLTGIGFIATDSYIGTAEWGCYGTDLPNVPNVPFNGGNPSGLGAEIGDGFNNTNNILKDCPTAPAALAARSYGPDWFLPSAKELNQMYINKTTLEGVSGFTAFSNYYWSSTEIDNDTAWGQFFGNGYQGINNKYFTVTVRAVRAF